MATEPSKYGNDLPIAEHGPSIAWLDQSRLETSVLVSRYDEEAGEIRDFRVVVSEVNL